MRYNFVLYPLTPLMDDVSSSNTEAGKGAQLHHTAYTNKPATNRARAVRDSALSLCHHTTEQLHCELTMTGYQINSFKTCSV